MSTYKSRLTALALLFLLSASAIAIRTARGSPAIVIMPDGSVDPSTPLIQVAGDIYSLTNNLSDAIEVRRSNIIIEGNGYILNGSGSEAGISLEGALWGVTNVTVRNLGITNFYYGIYLDESSNNTIFGNNLIDNSEGIRLGRSSFNNISRNTITHSTYGIWISGGSYNNTVSQNKITNSNFGALLFYTSLNTISENNMTQNFNGVYLISSSNNTILDNSISGSLYGMYFYPTSDDNTASGNTVQLNNVGIKFYNSSDNRIYENNFVNNTRHILYEYPGYTNIFNYEYPVGGNFWSNHTSSDSYYGIGQNQSGSDGITDNAYTINAENVDRFPLAGSFSSFRASPSQRVRIISNSTTLNFSYSDTNGTIKMLVANSSSSQSFGFVRATIPKRLIGPPYTIAVNAGLTPTLKLNDTLYDTTSSRWIYFAYAHSTHEITIQGIPPDITPPSISILSPESRTYTIRSIPLTFTLNEPVSEIRYSLDNQSSAAVLGNTTMPSLSDGPHTVTIFATDVTGNTGNSTTIHFSVDATPPTIQILSPENKTYATKGIPLTFMISGSTSWIGYSLDNKPNQTINGNTTITNLQDGTHTTVIYANDTLGNMGNSDKVHFAVQITSNDTTPPTILILSPANTTYTTPEDSIEVELNITVSEPVAWLAYSLDKKPNITITGNTTLLDLQDGSHSVIAYALDANGNVGTSETRNFTIQTHQQPSSAPFPSSWLIIIALLAIACIVIVVLFLIRRKKDSGNKH